MICKYFNLDLLSTFVLDPFHRNDSKDEATDSGKVEIFKGNGNGKNTETR
jgi:hypothetical protein